MPSSDRKTMTLNLTESEMDALEELARRKEMTKTALIRHALRLFQLIDHRIQQGDKLFFEDEVKKKKAEVMMVV